MEKSFKFFVQFLHERIEVAKYCSQDQIEMYTELLQRTLDIQLRRYHSSSTRIKQKGICEVVHFEEEIFLNLT
jgi:hypothetical protein